MATPGLLESIFYLLVGVAFLYAGAESLVRGSASVALRKGLSALVVGLTIVAYGTSSPELVVSFLSALEGKADIAIGNVVGSNICNIALIVGIAALIRPVKIKMQLISFDLIVLIAVSFLLYLLMLDGTIGIIDGAILTIGSIIYTYLTLKKSKAEDKEIDDEFENELKPSKRKPIIDYILIVVGIGGLVYGANVFVDGAIGIASMLGVSTAIIGLSVVAFGTSLPELATSLVASIKNEGDISIGNAIGSNIFNILFVLGLASLAHEIPTTDISYIDVFIMIGIAVLIFPLARIGMQIGRLKGALLLSIYVAYVYYLYLQV
jgi:cation:H+ antiporter